MQWSGKEALWTDPDGADTPEDNTNITGENLTVLEVRQVCPVLTQCALIHEELLTLWGGSPVSSLRKPRIPYPLPWINFFISAGKHLDVSTNAHGSLWALIILHYLNSNLRHFLMSWWSNVTKLHFWRQSSTYLPPMISRSFCRAFSAASLEKNWTKASPEFLPA